jgi:hypothetical protein
MISVTLYLLALTLDPRSHNLEARHGAARVVLSVAQWSVLPGLLAPLAGVWALWRREGLFALVAFGLAAGHVVFHFLVT